MDKNEIHKDISYPIENGTCRPSQIIKLPMEKASQFLGLTRNSLSTLSQGIAVQDKS